MARLRARSVVVNELRDLWDHSSSLDGASLTELERRYGELAAPFIAATSATDFFSAENLEAMPSECRDSAHLGRTSQAPPATRPGLPPPTLEK